MIWFDAREGFLDAPTRAIVLDFVNMFLITASLLRKEAMEANAADGIFHLICCLVIGDW